MDPQGSRCWQDVNLAAQVTVPSVPSHPQEVQGSGLRAELGLKDPVVSPVGLGRHQGGWSGHTTGVCVSPDAEVSDEPLGLSWKVRTPLGYAGAFTHAPRPVPQADLAPARTCVCPHMTLELVGVPTGIAALAAAEGPLARVRADMALQLARLDRQTDKPQWRNGQCPLRPMQGGWSSSTNMPTHTAGSTGGVGRFPCPKQVTTGSRRALCLESRFPFIPELGSNGYPDIPCWHP